MAGGAVAPQVLGEAVGPEPQGGDVVKGLRETSKGRHGKYGPSGASGDLQDKATKGWARGHSRA